MKRLFIAIPIPPELKLKLEKVSLENVSIKNTRWINPENLHITLCFIGNISEEKIPE